jgi:hypothetical protein
MIKNAAELTVEFTSAEHAELDEWLVPVRLSARGVREQNHGQGSPRGPFTHSEKRRH